MSFHCLFCLAYCYNQWEVPNCQTTLINKKFRIDMSSSFFVSGEQITATVRWPRFTVEIQRHYYRCNRKVGKMCYLNDKE